MDFIKKLKEFWKIKQFIGIFNTAKLLDF